MTATLEIPINERIKQEIGRFDIFSLLKLLESLGYKSGDIFYQSNPSLASSTSICHCIDFVNQSYPKVVLVLNMGLASNNSSLPSFFQKKMDEGSIDPILFSRFLSFFDHYLIKLFLSMGTPEQNGWFFSDWRETQREYLKLLALNSASTVALLFQLCIPELAVDVVKSPRFISHVSCSFTLGSTKLGKDSFLQRNEQLTIPSLKVFLTTDELLTEFSLPWASEIKKRFRELILPILKRVNVHLQIILRARNIKDPAILSFTSRLGYCCIGNHSHFLQFLLFSGYVKDAFRYETKT
jgi:hypothetical protein